MTINTIRKESFFRRLSMFVIAGFVFGAFITTISNVTFSDAQSVDELRQQSEELEAEIAETDDSAERMNQRARSIEGALEQLNADIAQTEGRIVKINGRIVSLQNDLDKAKKELERQKEILKSSMRSLYKKGDASTMELLAATDNFSEFIDEQEYLERLKTAMQESANKIIELQEKMEEQKAQQEELLSQEKIAKNHLNAARAERRQLLNETISEEKRLKSHSRALAERQREVNQELLRKSRIVSSGTSSGSYPWSNAICVGTGSSSGSCRWPIYEWYVGNTYNVLDPWGYYYRNCTSYVAWKSAQMGLELSGNGSMGDGGRWAQNAWKYDMTTGSTPKVGAFAVFSLGGFGHIAYVEDVSGGEVLISEYNFVADGVYSQRWIPQYQATSYVYPPWAQ